MRHRKDVAESLTEVGGENYFLGDENYLSHERTVFIYKTWEKQQSFHWLALTARSKSFGGGPS